MTAYISFAFSLVTLLVPNILMSLLTNDPTLITFGSEYLRLVSPSYLFTGLSQIFLCMLKNTGEAKKSSIISSSCMLLDMIMNLLLIVGMFGLPRLEIAGAAISTTITRCIELAWCTITLARKGNLQLRKAHRKSANTLLVRDFWTYTAPVLGNELVWGIGFTMSAVIMGHLGNDAVAANSVAGIAKNLASCFCLGLCNGGGILLGNLLGAGEYVRAKTYGDRLCFLALLIGIASGVMILLFRPLLLSISNLSVGTRAYLKWMLPICSYYMIGKSINSTTIAGIFCAGGDSKFGFVCDTIVMWCITVPVGFIAAFLCNLPVVAVYFIVSLDELLKIPAVCINYRKYKWIKNITIKEEQ